MSFQLNVPPSVVAKTSRLEEEEGDDGEPKKQSREDWKKLKELEEARKAGTAPAMQDEEGKDINPHIPQYIMQAPWYFGASQATLRHQRIQAEKIKEYNRMGQWYHRGVQKGQVATKYRKGACENCGSMTHKKKDCLERPRKTGAKFTGDKIAPDEFLQPDLSFDYTSKRDRWNGYDLDEHKRIVEEFAKIEEAKRQLKAERLDNSVLEVHQDDEDKDVEDEDKYADHIDMPGTKFETKQRITVRNLRIREDTAKYLYNLDVDSSYYDPKTRSMRENPFVKTGKDANELPYAGDNFVRWSGDAHGMAESQVFAWEAYEKGAEVNLQADPTKLEFLSKEYQKRKEDYKTDQKGSILAKYGGEEHLEAPPKQLLMAQTEDYVEYSRHGTVIKGQEKAKVKSIYEEDVYINNHTSVWGSFWKDGHWGYKCCHSFIKESYCTGEAGKSAEETTIPHLEEASEPEPVRSLMEQHQEKVKEKKKKKKNKKKKKKHKKKKESSSSSEEEEEEDPEAVRERKIQEAMKKLEEREKLADKLLAIDERKRPYNIMYDFDAPTEEEMEAYRRKQKRMEDPMANMFAR